MNGKCILKCMLLLFKYLSLPVLLLCPDNLEQHDCAQFSVFPYFSGLNILCIFVICFLFELWIFGICYAPIVEQNTQVYLGR